MTMRTVEIVGGGLAGLALGNGLRRRGVPVRVLEAGSYPRHRVCGEFITGLDKATREELGLEDILAEAVPARSVAWMESGRVALRHSLPEPALCLSRHRLDHAMAEAFTKRGGLLETGRRGDARAVPGRVLACGRRACRQSPWIGLKQHFRDLPLQADLEVHFGRHAYVGLTRVENSTVNVCGLFARPLPGGRAPLLDALRSRGLGELADRLHRAGGLEGTACAVAGLDYGVPSGGAAAIGDQGGLIPPFTGHGMTVALQSAALALDPLESWSRGRSTWSEAAADLQAGLRRLFGRRIAWARIMHPWILSDRRRALVQMLSRWGIFPANSLYRLCH